MTKRVFITGAAGFIGFHLARYLHAHGDIVIGYDNFNDYYSPKLKRARAAELRQVGMEVIEGDIVDSKLLNQHLTAFRPTHIAHLAAQAGVRYSLANPQAYVKANIAGFINVLEACRVLPEAKLVYASSSSVYGTNAKIPFAETDAADTPTSLYGATKKANEGIAHAYHHLYKFPVTGLRFFTVYGPWGRPDMAYFSFTKAILEGKPIEVYNHGEMQRDFTYVDDIVSGIAAALDRPSGCAVYNLGNDQPVELNHLVALIEQRLGKKATRIDKPLQPGDVLSTWADINLSRQRLDYAPTTPIDVGISRFIDWYRAYTEAHEVK